jgi:hypothetical protein
LPAAAVALLVEDAAVVAVVSTRPLSVGGTAAIPGMAPVVPPVCGWTTIPRAAQYATSFGPPAVALLDADADADANADAAGAGAVPPACGWTTIPRAAQ